MSVHTWLTPLENPIDHNMHTWGRNDKLLQAGGWAWEHDEINTTELVLESLEKLAAFRHAMA